MDTAYVAVRCFAGGAMLATRMFSKRQLGGITPRPPST